MAFLGIFKKKEDIPSPPSIRPTRLPSSPDELPNFEGDLEFSVPKSSMPDELPSFEPVKQQAMPIAPQPEVKPEINPWLQRQPSFEKVAPPKPEAPSIPDIWKARQFVEEKQEVESLESREHVDVSRPLFIQVALYKRMLAELAEGVNVLKNNETILLKLNDLRNAGDKQFEAWRLNLEDIERKLVFVDKTLFEKVS